MTMLSEKMNYANAALDRLELEIRCEATDKAIATEIRDQFHSLWALCCLMSRLCLTRILGACK